MDNLPRNRDEYRKWWAQNTDEPYGYCWCGCKQPTTTLPYSCASRYQVRGEPARYVTGHNRSKSPVEYKPEDRGYSTPCWVWQRHLNAGGYGQKTLRTPDGPKSVSAYRFYYEQKHGPISSGLELDHLCRVRACVNPDHLEPVTHSENMRRGAVAKLAPSDVEEIRRLRAEDGLFYYEIGRRYNLYPSTIGRICNRQSWA